MIEQLNLTARWAARKESVDACAGRSLKCLRELAQIDESFPRTWLKCGMSLSEALASKVELTTGSLREELAKGRNRLFDDLGFSLGRLWNGLDEGATHISLFCG